MQTVAFFDVCLIDCAPTSDLRMVYAQSVADFMLSPIQLDQEAVEGVTETINGRRGVRRVQAKFNPALRFIGILPNLVDQTLSQQFNGRERLCGPFRSSLDVLRLLLRAKRRPELWLLDKQVKSEFQSSLDADESERKPSAEWSKYLRYLPVTAELLGQVRG